MVNSFEVHAAGAVFAFFLFLAWIGIPFYIWQLGGAWMILAVPVAIIVWGGTILVLIGNEIEKAQRRRNRRRY